MCKEEQCLRTRPLEKGRGQQYGIAEDSIPPGARVCNTCQCKSVRSRYTSCPLPTCPNPKDRVKRFRNLPSRLFELAPEIRDPFIQEFQIPPNVTKCCSACLIKIKRKLGPHLLGTTLTDDEIAKFKTLLQENGPKWQQLADALGKTAVALKSFYFHYQKKYSFDLAVTEYYKLHPSEERRSAITDGDESDLSTSSCDEREGGSDTASAESPKTSSGTTGSNTNAPITVKKEDGSCSSNNSGRCVSPTSAKFSQNLHAAASMDTISPELSAACIFGRNVAKPGETPRQENIIGSELLPPIGQPPPRKQKTTEEYDSSATETADEENETSPGNRQSPKVLLYPPNQTTITMVPSSMQNGPRDSMHPELNVRDVMLNVIERSLKTGQQPPPPPKSSISKPNMMDSRADITFVREYRNDLSKPSLISNLSTNSQQQQQQQQQHQQLQVCTVTACQLLKFLSII